MQVQNMMLTRPPPSLVSLPPKGTWLTHLEPWQNIKIIYSKNCVFHMAIFFSVFLLLLLLLLMGLSQPKSYNYKEVLVNWQLFLCKNDIQYTGTMNVCDTNNFNPSQDLEDGDDYLNTADLNVYGNLWRKKKLSSVRSFALLH